MSDTFYVKAWGEDPVLRPGQLTHAARRGESPAVCGVVVAAWGDDWPASGSNNPRESRCNICTQGAQGRQQRTVNG